MHQGRRLESLPLKAMDLAVLDSNSGSLLRFKGRGNGAFDALPPVDVGNGPKAIDAADLNGDGKADLAFLTNNVYGINVLLNIGEGDSESASSSTTTMRNRSPSFLFASGPPPAVPGPPDLPCGIDPDASGSREDLGCLSYSGCDSGD